MQASSAVQLSAEKTPPSMSARTHSSIWMCCGNDVSWCSTGIVAKREYRMADLCLPKWQSWLHLQGLLVSMFCTCVCCCFTDLQEISTALWSALQLLFGQFCLLNSAKSRRAWLTVDSLWILQETFANHERSTDILPMASCSCNTRECMYKQLRATQQKRVCQIRQTQWRSSWQGSSRHNTGSWLSLERSIKSSPTCRTLWQFLHKHSSLWVNTITSAVMHDKTWKHAVRIPWRQIEQGSPSIVICALAGAPAKHSQLSPGRIWISILSIHIPCQSSSAV